MASTKYQRVRAHGVLLDRYTLQAFNAADAKMYRDTGKRLIVVQGSYNTGGVAASAGTHDGGGALDLSIRNLTYAQTVHAIKCLRWAGFAAEWRYSPPFSGAHIHAIQLGNVKVSAGAAFQVTEYRAGRSGLASRGRGTLMGYRPTKPWRYTEPVPVSKRTSGGKIKQTWKIRKGQTARFRTAPSASADKNVVVRTSGMWVMVEWRIVKDTDGKRRKYLMTKSKRWTNSAQWSKIS